MSLHAAAKLVADRIRSLGYGEIIAHHDADGIAAATILAHAMARTGIRFRLRVKGDILPGDLAGDAPYILCDIGAGMENLPDDTIVVDHHNPHFRGKFHVNPRLYGIDGDREISACGAAYLVASNLGDNRDLAGLAMLGIIGDGQELAGMNLEIFSDGVANGIVTVGRGLRLAGRDLPERLLTAVTPMLDGISGDEAKVAAITGPAGADGTLDEKRILSLCVLAAIRSHTAGCVEMLYGDTYGLEREVITDAHSFAAVVDACGKAGRGDIAAALCLRSSRDAGAAWETARLHRLKVIGAVRSLAGQDTKTRFYEIEDPVIASDVADALACHSITGAPVAVIACAGDSCRVSARCPDGTVPDLGATVRSIAQACGGSGGGAPDPGRGDNPCRPAGELQERLERGGGGMMRLDGTITTTHRNPSCVAGAIRVDNLSAMGTEASGDTVRTTIAGTKLRSVIASVDDYLMNLAIADEACRYLQDKSGKKTGTRTVRGQHTKK